MACGPPVETGVADSLAASIIVERLSGSSFFTCISHVPTEGLNFGSSTFFSGGGGFLLIMSHVPVDGFALHLRVGSRKPGKPLYNLSKADSPAFLKLST